MRKVLRVSLAVLLPAWAIYRQSMRELDRLTLFDPPDTKRRDLHE